MMGSSRMGSSEVTFTVYVAKQQNDRDDEDKVSKPTLPDELITYVKTGGSHSTIV